MRNVNYLLIALTLFLSVICIRQCTNIMTIKKQTENNINALTDSVRHYKTVADDIAASKTLLIGDISLLKKTNDSLYRKVKELGIKKPSQVVYIKGNVDNGRKDTIWKYRPSLPSQHHFDFSDKWRELSGNVALKDSTMTMSIDRDIVHIDFTTAIKDNRLYISSSNPYVRFNDIQGIVIPKQRQRHWHIGPYVGVSISTDAVIRPAIGVGLSYSILSF